MKRALSSLFVALLLVGASTAWAETPGGGGDYGQIEVGGGGGYFDGSGVASGDIDMNGNDIIGDADGDSRIDFGLDDQFRFYHSNSLKYTFSASRLTLATGVLIGGVDGKIQPGVSGALRLYNNAETQTTDIFSDGTITANTTGVVLINSLAYGESVVTANATNTTIASSGVWVQVTQGVVTGNVNGITFASAELTISSGNGGMYGLSCVFSAENPGGGTNDYLFGILKDTGGGDAIIADCQQERSISAGGSSAGVSVVSCFESLSAGDVVSAGVQNQTDTDDTLVSYMNCTARRLGS